MWKQTYTFNKQHQILRSFRRTKHWLINWTFTLRIPRIDLAAMYNQYVVYGWTDIETANRLARIYLNECLDIMYINFCYFFIKENTTQTYTQSDMIIQITKQWIPSGLKCDTRSTALLSRKKKSVRRRSAWPITMSILVKFS